MFTVVAALWEPDPEQPLGGLKLWHLETLAQARERRAAMGSEYDVGLYRGPESGSGAGTAVSFDDDHETGSGAA